VAVCVDAMTAPFRRQTSKGDSANYFPLQLALATGKCPVQSDSKRAVEFDCRDGIQFK
jgi:hypothetical protein